MSSPPIPPLLDHLATRPFSFYPPILNIERNEWLFRRATWSDILVVNCKSGDEIWIPRRFLGEVSRVDDPVLIVGLAKELEFKAGAVWPYQRRIIEMPVAVGGTSASVPEPERGERARVVDIRVPPNTDRRIIRVIGGALAVVIVLYLGAVSTVRVGELRQRVTVVRAADQSYLTLTSRDDYAAIIARLGTPEADHWLSDSGELQYRALAYPSRGYTVILMGSSRNAASYIGTMDERWRPLHSVELRAGGTTGSLLHGLRRF
jgi:hypothetical protein